MNSPVVVGIIPARGGSKGIPDKNIRELGGFPVIAYSAAVSQMVSRLTRTIVSTDSMEIAEIAERFGADVPFLRPVEISGDHSIDLDYLKHAIEWFLETENYTPDYWVLLRPTTPLRDPETVDRAIQSIIDHPEATSLVSVHEFPENPGKMFGMQDGYLHGLCPLDPRPEYFTLPRQAFAPAFIGNGYVDIIRSSTVRNMDALYGPRMLGFQTPDTGELDVEDDLKKLEFYIGQYGNKISRYLREI